MGNDELRHLKKPISDFIKNQLQMTYLREMKSTFIPAVSVGAYVSQAHTKNYENEHVWMFNS